MVRTQTFRARALALFALALVATLAALGGGPAQAVGGFGISGTVTYDSLPVTAWTRGVRVTVDGPVNQTVAVDVSTGYYAFADLPAGTYTVHAWAEEFEYLGVTYRPNLVPTYYSGSHVAESSWPVTIGPSGVASIDITMTLGGSLEGDVYFDGAVSNGALEGVAVTVTGPDGIETSTRADSNGSYSLWGLLPGFYTARFSPTEYFDGATTHPAPGFVPVSYRNVYSGAGWDFEVAAGAETDLFTQALLRSTSISGTVSIEEGSNSEFIKGVTVVAKARGRALEKAATPNFATGEYSIAELRLATTTLSSASGRTSILLARLSLPPWPRSSTTMCRSQCQRTSFPCGPWSPTPPASMPSFRCRAPSAESSGCPPTLHSPGSRA